MQKVQGTCSSERIGRIQKKKWKADNKQHLENADKNFEGGKGLMTLLLDVLKFTE